MKRITIVGAVVAAAGCLGVLGAAQGGLYESSARAPSIPWPGNHQTNVIVISSPGSNWLLQASVPAHKLEFKIQAFPPSARRHSPSAPPTIPAGVYRTVPYSCNVVVPGPNPDDRCIVTPAGGDSSMPIVKPELRFIPWHAAK